jgi:hypothetical protein
MFAATVLSQLLHVNQQCTSTTVLIWGGSHSSEMATGPACKYPLPKPLKFAGSSVQQCAAVCGSVQQCAAVCSSVQQCAAVCSSVQQCAAHTNRLRCIATCLPHYVQQCPQCLKLPQKEGAVDTLMINS